MKRVTDRRLLLPLRAKCFIFLLKRNYKKPVGKAYRSHIDPYCWKLLSDYLPLNVDLQQNTIEQKRNTYWNWVNEHYSKTYLDAHQDILRQVR